ncbi:MAG: beta-ketoacyl synthase chain length factor, partial [Burkholderiales bacterium]|nr:beta-ketoacyl synthase chain length factor [Burkholderiales bacterium]
MSGYQVHIEGIGLLGPGIKGWLDTAPVLRGEMPYQSAPIVLPPPEGLPAAERRRAGVAIKLSMAVAMEAARDADADPAKLANVFSSTGGDCENCHAILEVLASSERLISPTRFHNSVHNA